MFIVIIQIFPWGHHMDMSSRCFILWQRLLASRSPHLRSARGTIEFVALVAFWTGCGEIWRNECWMMLKVSQKCPINQSINESIYTIHGFGWIDVVRFHWVENKSFAQVAEALDQKLRDLPSNQRSQFLAISSMFKKKKMWLWDNFWLLQ